MLMIPNLNKFAILFSKNVDDTTKAHIKNIFPVPDLLPSTVHLGHPLIFTHRDKNRAYNFIYNKFLAKLPLLKLIKSTMWAVSLIFNWFFLLFPSIICLPLFSLKLLLKSLFRL